jgi:hypothetical protein
MDLTVGQETHQMRFACLSGILDRRKQSLILKKFPGGYLVIHAGDVHPYDSAGADIKMSYF